MNAAGPQSTSQNGGGAPRGRGNFRGRGRGGYRYRSNSRNRSKERGWVDRRDRTRSVSADKRNNPQMVAFDMVNVNVDALGEVNIYDDAPNKETAAFNRLVTKFAIEGHRGVATILFDFPAKKERYEQVNNDPFGRVFEDMKGAQEHLAKLPNILNLFKNNQSKVLPCPNRRELATAGGPTVNEVKIVSRPKASDIASKVESIKLNGLAGTDLKV